MGEIIGIAVVAVLVLAVLGGGMMYVNRDVNAHAPVVKTADYRNHLGMARWIEHGLGDDMERACIPEERQAAARRLLAAFYEEEK